MQRVYFTENTLEQIDLEYLTSNALKNTAKYNK